MKNQKTFKERFFALSKKQKREIKHTFLLRAGVGEYTFYRILNQTLEATPIQADELNKLLAEKEKAALKEWADEIYGRTSKE